MEKYFELKALASHLFEQLVNNSEEDRIELCDMVETHFPEFIYKGRAYRYRYATTRVFKPSCYKSYAKTLKGAQTFLDNEKFGFKLDEETKTELIEAEVEGVDMVSLSKHLVRLGLVKAKDVEIFYSEEEIVVTKINSYLVK